jgi:predicted nucleotidyltransferase
MTVDDIARRRLGVEPEQIAEMCRKWRIAELSLFGSVLRDDFRPDSDVDVLVTFAPASLGDVTISSACRRSQRAWSGVRSIWRKNA